MNSSSVADIIIKQEDFVKHLCCSVTSKKQHQLTKYRFLLAKITNLILCLFCQAFVNNFNSVCVCVMWQKLSRNWFVFCDGKMTHVMFVVSWAMLRSCRKTCCHWSSSIILINRFLTQSSGMFSHVCMCLPGILFIYMCVLLFMSVFWHMCHDCWGSGCDPEDIFVGDEICLQVMKVIYQCSILTVAWLPRAGRFSGRAM